MGKKKSPNNKKPHPTKTFQDMVAEATLKKLGGFITQQTQQLGQIVMQRVGGI